MRTILLLLVGLIGLTSCSTAPHPLPFVPNADEARGHRVFAVGHGWHVGWVLPAEPIVARLPALKARFGEATHFEFGWGDKGFYQAEEITTRLALEAMFASRGAVMHVVALPPSANPPFDTFSAADVVELCVSEREMNALTEFVQQSFLKDATNAPISMRKGIYGNSQFYEAAGRFHMFNTCNKWVAKGMASMGLEVNSTFALTSGNVLAQLKASGRAMRVAANGVTTQNAAACNPQTPSLRSAKRHRMIPVGRGY